MLRGTMMAPIFARAKMMHAYSTEFRPRTATRSPLPTPRPAPPSRRPPVSRNDLRRNLPQLVHHHGRLAGGDDSDVSRPRLNILVDRRKALTDRTQGGTF